MITESPYKLHPYMPLPFSLPKHCADEDQGQPCKSPVIFRLATPYGNIYLCGTHATTGNASAFFQREVQI